jgi:pyridoxal phosphate enzyme (YggS family)
MDNSGTGRDAAAPFPEDHGHVAANLAWIRERIAAAAARAGRDPASVQLVAVSKTFPAAAVQAAHAAGQRLFGENRVQELAAKAPELPPDIAWHLIGHLQGNKAAKAVEHAACLQAVDSTALLQRLDRLAGEAGRRLPILLEVNVSGEAGKFGLRGEAEIQACAEAALASPHLAWQGLMTMAPFAVPEAELRRVFAALRDLRDRLARDLAAPLPELSMGMSGDFEPAIAEGATLVRIGTAIFGTR